MIIVNPETNHTFLLNTQEGGDLLKKFIKSYQYGSSLRTNSETNTNTIKHNSMNPELKRLRSGIKYIFKHNDVTFYFTHKFKRNYIYIGGFYRAGRNDNNNNSKPGSGALFLKAIIRNYLSLPKFQNSIIIGDFVKPWWEKQGFTIIDDIDDIDSGVLKGGLEALKAWANN